MIIIKNKNILKNLLKLNEWRMEGEDRILELGSEAEGRDGVGFRKG